MTPLPPPLPEKTTFSLNPRQKTQQENKAKKTREQPNLSDCHCCKKRFITTNPKNKLQTLISEWRIVLLCKSCYKLVETSKYCSYCLSEIDVLESCNLECKKCHRKVHRRCFDSNVGEFDVCFDCWMPRLIEKEYNRVRVEKMLKRRRVCGEEGERKKQSLSSEGGDVAVEGKEEEKKGLDGVKRRKGKGEVRLRSGKVCGEKRERRKSMEGSEVVLLEAKEKGVKRRREGERGSLDEEEKRKELEEVLKEANDEAMRKKALAVEAKEKAIKKAVVARRAIELASGALGVVAVRKGGEGGSVEEDDASMAFKLHRTMNSSPRLSRELCVLNTDCVDVPRVERNVDDWGGIVCALPAPGGDKLRSRRMLAFKGLENKSDCAQTPGGTEEKKGSESNNGSLFTYSRRGRGSQKGTGSFSRMYSGKPLLEEKRNGEHGHCLHTYRRRHPAKLPSKTKVVFDLEQGVLTPAITLNSSVESRAFANSS